MAPRWGYSRAKKGPKKGQKGPKRGQKGAKTVRFSGKCSKKGLKMCSKIVLFTAYSRPNFGLKKGQLVNKHISEQWPFFGTLKAFSLCQSKPVYLCQLAFLRPLLIFQKRELFWNIFGPKRYSRAKKGPKRAKKGQKRAKKRAKTVRVPKKFSRAKYIPEKFQKCSCLDTVFRDSCPKIFAKYIPKKFSKCP